MNKGKSDKDLAAAVGEFGEAGAKFTQAAVGVAATAANEVVKTSTKVVDDAMHGVSDMAKAITNAQRKSQLDAQRKYYNPVTREEFNDPSFDLPYIIVIEDEDKWKGIKAMQKAIGSLEVCGGKDNRIEVLHLAYEFVSQSGLEFYPIASIGSGYLQDKFQSQLYIDAACYLETIRDAEVTELKEIARKLGAVECRVELIEGERRQQRGSKSRKGKGNARVPVKGISRKGKENARVPVKGIVAEADASVKASEENEQSDSSERSLLFYQKFSGGAKPMEPELHWFKNDREVRSLIKARLSDANSVTEYHKKLSSKAVAIMNQKRARSIDAALGVRKNAKGHVSVAWSMEEKAKREAHSSLEIHIRF